MKTQMFSGEKMCISLHWQYYNTVNPQQIPHISIDKYLLNCGLWENRNHLVNMYSFGQKTKAGLLGGKRL